MAASPRKIPAICAALMCSVLTFSAAWGRVGMPGLVLAKHLHSCCFWGCLRPRKVGTAKESRGLLPDENAPAMGQRRTVDRLSTDAAHSGHCPPSTDKSIAAQWTSCNFFVQWKVLPASSDSYLGRLTSTT